MGLWGKTASHPSKYGVLPKPKKIRRKLTNIVVDPASMEQDLFVVSRADLNRDYRRLAVLDFHVPGLDIVNIPDQECSIRRPTAKPSEVLDIQGVQEEG